MPNSNIDNGESIYHELRHKHTDEAARELGRDYRVLTGEGGNPGQFSKIFTDMNSRLKSAGLPEARAVMDPKDPNKISGFDFGGKDIYGTDRANTKHPKGAGQDATAASEDKLRKNHPNPSDNFNATEKPGSTRDGDQANNSGDQNKKTAPPPPDLKPGVSIGDGSANPESGTYNALQPPGFEGKNGESVSNNNEKDMGRHNLDLRNRQTREMLPDGQGGLKTSYEGTLGGRFLENERTFKGEEHVDSNGKLTNREVVYDKGIDLSFDNGHGGKTDIAGVTSVDTSFNKASGKYESTVVGEDGKTYRSVAGTDGKAESITPQAKVERNGDDLKISQVDGTRAEGRFANGQLVEANIGGDKYRKLAEGGWRADNGKTLDGVDLKTDGTISVKNDGVTKNHRPDTSQYDIDDQGRMTYTRTTDGSQYLFKYSGADKAPSEVTNRSGHYVRQPDGSYKNDNGATWKGSVSTANNVYSYSDGREKVTINEDGSVTHVNN